MCKKMDAMVLEEVEEEDVSVEPAVGVVTEQVEEEEEESDGVIPMEVEVEKSPPPPMTQANFYDAVLTTRPLSFILLLPTHDKPKLANINGRSDSSTLVFISWFIHHYGMEEQLNVDGAKLLLFHMRRNAHMMHVMGGTVKELFEFDQEVYDTVLPKEIPVGDGGGGGILIVNLPDGHLAAFSSGLRRTILFLHAIAEKGVDDLKEIRAFMKSMAKSRGAGLKVEKGITDQMDAVIEKVEYYEKKFN